MINRRKMRKNDILMVCTKVEEKYVLQMYFLNCLKKYFKYFEVFFSIFSFIHLILNIFEFFRKLEFSEGVLAEATSKNLELKGYFFDALPEDLRAPRLVRVGLVQHAIAEPTTAPISRQREAIHNRIREIVEIAPQCGVNIICFQKAWSKRMLFSYFKNSLLVYSLLV